MLHCSSNSSLHLQCGSSVTVVVVALTLACCYIAVLRYGSSHCQVVMVTCHYNSICMMVMAYCTITDNYYAVVVTYHCDAKYIYTVVVAYN